MQIAAPNSAIGADGSIAYICRLAIAANNLEPSRTAHGLTHVDLVTGDFKTVELSQPTSRMPQAGASLKSGLGRLEGCVDGQKLQARGFVLRRLDPRRITNHLSQHLITTADAHDRAALRRQIANCRREALRPEPA